jgi:adenylate cyclase
MVFGICAVITAIFLFLQHRGFVPLKEAEGYMEDFSARLGRKTPIDPRLVLLGIDRPSYDDLIRPEEATSDPVLAALRQPYPWSRTVWAALIERLANAGAKTIVIDVLFAAQKTGDEELRKALDMFANRVVIASNFDPVETDRGTLSRIIVPNSNIISDTAERPAALDNRVGFVNIWPDEDNVIRSVKFRVANAELGNVVEATPQTAIFSLDTRALAKFGELSHIPPGTESHRIRFTAPPGLAFRIHSVCDVLTPKLWKSNYGNGEFFRDKLVMIGPTTSILHDFHRTPFTVDMAGPEIHLNIINAALHDEFLVEPPSIAKFALIGLAGIFAALLGVLIRNPVRRLGMGLLLNGGYLFGAQILFDYANVIVLTVAPLLVLDLSTVTLLAYDFVVEKLERAKLRHTMGLYFSPRVLDAVLANPGSMEPRRADVTLLLTDLRNSTPLAERLGPKAMFELLNRVFEVQTNAIMSEEGNLEHFLGDQFLSYWGAPQAQSDGPDRAERAALKLITAMEELSSTLSEDVRQLFGYGVALHSGRVLVGNKGSARRLDYGLVGDAVNEAARVESLTKYFGVRLLLSRETFAQLQQQGTRRLVDRIIVKGKNTPVELFERENLCVPKNYLELCRRYKAAYDEYFFGHFDAAQTQFENLIAEFQDGPSRVLAARCAELKASPPAGWNGIWKMDGK